MNTEQTISTLTERFAALGAKSTLLKEDVRIAVNKIIRTSLDKYKLFAYPQGVIPRTELDVGPVVRSDTGEFVARIMIKGEGVALANIRYAE